MASKTSEDYTPTPVELDQARSYTQRRDQRPAAPRMKATDGSLEPDHASPDHWLIAMESAFGTTEATFADRLASQLFKIVRTSRDKPLAESAANSALAAMYGIAPRDETEAMLATQMVATHEAAMRLLAEAVSAKYQQHLQNSGNLSVKLLRTYVAQVEALQRYRGKGEQKVTVEHVHVHKGGQAIVGNVEGGPRGVGVSSKTEE